MPQYFMFHLRNPARVDASTYYSDKSIPLKPVLLDPNNSLHILSSPVKLLDRDQHQKFFPPHWHAGDLAASSRVVSFSTTLTEVMAVLQAHNCRFCSFTGCPEFSRALSRTSGGRLAVRSSPRFGNEDVSAHLVSYLETNGIRVRHCVEDAPECRSRHISKATIDALQIKPALIEHIVPPTGREKMYELIVGPPDQDWIAESLGFTQRFRNDPAIKRLAERLKEISLDISTSSRGELDLGTSFLIDRSVADSRSTADARSIYSRENLEEKTIQGYRRIIKRAKSVKDSMETLSFLRSDLEKTGTCPELLELLGNTRTISAINERMRDVRSEIIHPPLGDWAGHVISPGVDEYLDVCRRMYEEKLARCEEIASAVRQEAELEVYLFEGREVCLMRRNEGEAETVGGKKAADLKRDSSNERKAARERKSAKERKSSKRRRRHVQSASDDLFILKTTKTMVLYTTPQLRLLNKTVKGLLDQLVEIEGRLCKAILCNLQRFEQFFIQVSNLALKLGLLIENAIASVHLKRPEICTNTRIHSAAHVLFPDFQASSYLFDEYGVYVITGANMAGKSCYLKNFAHTALLLRAGRYLDCDGAGLPLFDEIHTISNVEDVNTVTELILKRPFSHAQNYRTPSRLVLIDELQCSTKIQLALAELLRRSKTLALFVTHRTELIEQLKGRGYKMCVYENYQLRAGVNDESSVSKICARYFPELAEE